EENEQAWREYSGLIARALKAGRLWQPLQVGMMAKCILAIVAEMDEIERVTAAFNEAGEDEEKAAKIESPFKEDPPLKVVDALADTIERSRDEARRIAGYLSQDAQPPMNDVGEEAFDPKKQFVFLPLSERKPEKGDSVLVHAGAALKIEKYHG